MSATAATAIELIQSHSLTTLVQRELERRILSGEMAPGDKLNEADVAGELNVSRSPVREAFRALEQVGLVRMEKNRGVFVRQLSLMEADELYEIRASLDALIGRLAAERITPEQVDELRGMLRTMQKAARRHSVNDYYPLNLQFHDRVAQIAGNQALLGVYRRLVNELHLYRRQTLARGPDSFPVSTREHAEILERLAQRDSEGAAQILRSHARESRARLHATLGGQIASVKTPGARRPKTKASL